MRANGMQPLAIEVAIQKEKVGALNAVAYKLEGLLAQLAAIEASARVAGAPKRWELVKEHARLRAEAERQRWYMVVQREAMGLAHHDDVERIYPLPPPLR
jgi:hypothetical protein